MPGIWAEVDAATAENEKRERSERNKRRIRDRRRRGGERATACCHAAERGAAGTGSRNLPVQPVVHSSGMKSGDGERERRQLTIAIKQEVKKGRGDKAGAGEKRSRGR